MRPTFTYVDLVSKEDEIEVLLRSRAPFEVSLSAHQVRAAREAMSWDNASPRDWPLHRYAIGFFRSYFAQTQFFLLYKKAQRHRMKVVFADPQTCVATLVPA
jgi:hypothetical protein